MTTAVIVQARIGSSRLPGKVLLPLGTRTVLEEVLRRCRAIPGANVVCCAIPSGDIEEPLAVIARQAGVEVYRGPEGDVLARYLGAARFLGAATVMRVTSDCPLIDPDLCGNVLELRRKSAVDYACNNMPPSYPHGLDCEAFTTAALALAADRATEPAQREHVTPWLRTAAETSRAVLQGPGGKFAAMRWTLDYPEDMAFLSAVFAVLDPPPAIPSWLDVAALVDKRPDIAAINADRRIAR